MQSTEVSFDLSRPLKRGNLLKQGGFHRAFKHREFILYPGFLVYYDNEKSWRQDIAKGDELAGRLGSVKLNGATINIAKNAPKGCKYGILLLAPDIENKRQDYLVNASSKKERDDWIDSLRKASPLISKNLSRKTTALKAATTRSSRFLKDDDDLGIGTIDSASDEDCEETNIDDILGGAGDTDSISSDRQESSIDAQPLGAHQESDLDDESHAGDGDVPTETSLTHSRSEWVEHRVVEDDSSVVEISIEVGNSESSGQREGSGNVGGVAASHSYDAEKNSAENNNNSPKNVAMSPNKKDQKQQNKDKPKSKYSMISPGVFQRTSSHGSASGEWHNPADVEAQRVFVPGVGWRVHGMNAAGMPQNLEQNSSLVADEAKEIEKEENSEEHDQDSAMARSPILEVKAQSYRTIIPYTANGPAQISFGEGETLYVLDKLEDGWWFASNGKDEGWAPCSYLEGGKDEEGITNLEGRTEMYYSVDEYTPEEDDEIPLSCGEVVEVVRKSMDGWWMVKDKNSRMGLAPATFLKKVVTTDAFCSPGSSPRRRPPPLPAQRIYQQPPRKASVRAKARLKTQHGVDDHTLDHKLLHSPTPLSQPVDQQTSRTPPQTESPTKRAKYSPSNSQNSSCIEQERGDAPPHVTARKAETKTEFVESISHKPAVKTRTKSPQSNLLVKSQSLDAGEITREDIPLHQRALSSTLEPRDTSRQDRLLAEGEGPKRPAERPKSYEIRQAKLRARSTVKEALKAKSDAKISVPKSNTMRSENKERRVGPVEKKIGHISPSSHSPIRGMSPSSRSPIRGVSPSSRSPIRGVSPQKSSPKKRSRSRDNNPAVNAEALATPPQERQGEAMPSSHENSAAAANSLIQYIMSSGDPAVKEALKNIIDDTKPK